MHALWHHFTETRIFSEGEEPEVNSSSFTNTWTVSTSSGFIDTYVPRAFQRAAPRLLIRKHVRKPSLSVRNHPIPTVRSG